MAGASCCWLRLKLVLALVVETLRSSLWLGSPGQTIHLAGASSRRQTIDACWSWWMPPARAGVRADGANSNYSRSEKDMVWPRQNVAAVRHWSWGKRKHVRWMGKAQIKEGSDWRVRPLQGAENRSGLWEDRPLHGEATEKLLLLCGPDTATAVAPLSNMRREWGAHLWASKLLCCFVTLGRMRCWARFPLAATREPDTR